MQSLRLNGLKAVALGKKLHEYTTKYEVNLFKINSAKQAILRNKVP